MTDLGLTLRQTSKPASITPNIHMRLNKVIKELNVSIQRVADTLKDHGIDGEITLNTKITEEQYETLKKTFAKPSISRSSYSIAPSKKHFIPYTTLGSVVSETVVEM